MIQGKKFSEEKEQFSYNKDIFKYRLFLEEEFSDIDHLSNEETEDSEGNVNNNEIKDFKESKFLSSDLVEKIVTPEKSEDTLKISEKNEYKYPTSNNNWYLLQTPMITNVNSLVPLIDYGYEFVPKSFNKMMLNDNNKAQKTKNNCKKDWVCSFCKNLNFSFRKNCNRCKASKKNSQLNEKKKKYGMS